MHFFFFYPPALAVLPIEPVFRFSESRTERGLSHGLTKQRAWLPSLLYDCTGTETEASARQCAAGWLNDSSRRATVEALFAARHRPLFNCAHNLQERDNKPSSLNHMRLMNCPLVSAL